MTLGIPLLSGMLKSQGHDVEILDGNSMFMNFVASKEFFVHFENKIEFFKQCLQKEQNPFLINYLKYYIEMFYAHKQYLKPFYDKNPNPQKTLKELQDSNINLQRYYSMLRSLISRIFNNSYNSPSEKIPPQYGLFHDWELNNIYQKIVNFNPDLIGFSTNCPEQFLWSKLFAKKIKQNITSKIIFGGSEIFHLGNRILNKQYFNDCFDALIYGEGETAFKLLAQNEKFENIPSLIWYDKPANKFVINKAKQENSTLNVAYFTEENNDNITVNDVTYKHEGGFKFYKPNYEGIDFSKYFLPQSIINLEGSRSCYWNRCEFCLYVDGSTYKQKKVDDLIEEIKENIDKYNVSKFYFTDSAIHPEVARELSKKILENNLKLQWSSFLRLEPEFDEQLLKQMYNSGYRVALWGVESGSDRILKLYKKGTNSKTNAEILKKASQAGFCNFCWIMVDFPQETIEDLDLTRQFVINNFDYIDYIQVCTFGLYKNAPLVKHLEDFGLNKKDFNFEGGIGNYNAPQEIKNYSRQIEFEFKQMFREKMINWACSSDIIIKFSTITK